MAKKRREGEEEQPSSPWSELPLEVQSMVLGWLPLRSLFRFKSVCKLWNSTISSPSFTHFPPLHNCPSNSPWLIFFSPNFLLAFDFYEHSWFKFDVGFLSSMLNLNPARTSSSPPSAQHGSVWCSAAASGLLLLNYGSSLHVCNPLTKSLMKLPQFKCIDVPVTLGFAIANTRVPLTPARSGASLSLHHRLGCNLAPGTSSTGPDRNAVQGLLMPMHVVNNVTEQNSCASDLKHMDATTQGCSCSDGYTVVVVGKSKRSLVIEAYCPIKNSWDIVGSMPAPFIIGQVQMIACNGLFYGLLLNPMGMLVIGESGLNWRIQDMPMGNPREIRRLLVCQSSISMVCLVVLDDKGSCIWRYEADSRSWIKVHVMPDHILQAMKTVMKSYWVDCVGVGNYICFQAIGSRKVLTYDICNELWSWLPDQPDAYETIVAKGMQFEPRLDVTQSV